MKIRKKLPFGFGVMVAMVGLVAVVAWTGHTRVMDADLVDREMENLFNALAQAETQRDEFRVNETPENADVVASRISLMLALISEMQGKPGLNHKSEDLQAIQTEVQAFETEFQAYAQKAFESQELQNANSAATVAFRSTALEMAEGARKRSDMLGKLIGRVDEQLNNADQVETFTKLVSLVTAAQRLRGRVAEGQLAEKLSLRLVQNILLIENAKLQYLATASEDSAAVIDQAAKQIFLTSLRLKKIVPENTKATVDGLLKSVRDLRATFSSITTLNAERVELYDTMKAAGDRVKKIIAVSVDQAKVDMDEAGNTSLVLMLIGVAIALVVAAFISLTTTRSIIRPIDQIIESMGLLRQGDFSKEIEVNGRKDEFGEMLQAVEVFRQNGLENEKLRQDQERLRGERDEADKRATEERRKAILNMADDLEGRIKSAVDKITGSVGHVKETSDKMTQNAAQTGDEATSVSGASAKATSNVETVSAASTELASSIEEISRQVTQVSNNLREGVLNAQAANQQVLGLSEAAKTIGDVVNLITDIANQTNLLALNATIEAARAGEAGKGFAVVASEVKSLANQTASATEQIERQIKEIQLQTKDSVTSIEDITKMISGIDEMASGIAAAVEEQHAATGDIAHNVDMAARGTQSVSKSITLVADAATQTGNLSSELRDVAGELELESSHLAGEVNKFLAELRA